MASSVMKLYMAPADGSFAQADDISVSTTWHKMIELVSPAPSASPAGPLD